MRRRSGKFNIELYRDVPAMIRRLHIGGELKMPGWEVLNANPAPYVDHVCNANNLSKFADGTFSEIYASHVVEHLDYVGELHQSLQDWHRVLTPGGKAYISVPDMDTLAGMFRDKATFTMVERFEIMRMIFGGHLDKHDYHLAGLNEELLTDVLRAAGFANAQRVQNFGMFEDMSSLLFKGVPISLNMIAEK